MYDVAFSIKGTEYSDDSGPWQTVVAPEMAPAFAGNGPIVIAKEDDGPAYVWRNRWWI